MVGVRDTAVWFGLGSGLGVKSSSVQPSLPKLNRGLRTNASPTKAVYLRRSWRFSDLWSLDSGREAPSDAKTALESPVLQQIMYSSETRTINDVDPQVENACSRSSNAAASYVSPGTVSVYGFRFCFPGVPLAFWLFFSRTCLWNYVCECTRSMGANDNVFFFWRD